MATEHTLTASSWTDLGPLPLAVKQIGPKTVLIDYAMDAASAGPQGIPLAPHRIETCGPLAENDPRHEFARAGYGSARVAVIPGYSGAGA